LIGFEGRGMSTLWKSDIPGKLRNVLEKETEMERFEKRALSRALLQLYQSGSATRRLDSLPFIIDALSTEDADLAVSALGVVVEDGAFLHPHEIQDSLSSLPSALDKMFKNRDIPSCVRASAARILTRVAKQGTILQSIESKFMQMKR
jgi:hypothetical protein